MSAERLIVEKATCITHISALERDDTSAIPQNSYELTKCDLYLDGTKWHPSWRSPPNNVATCVFCIGAMDDS